MLIKVKALREFRRAEVEEKLSAAAMQLAAAAETWAAGNFGPPLAVVVIALPLLTESAWQMIDHYVGKVIEPVRRALKLSLHVLAVDSRGNYQGTASGIAFDHFAPISDLNTVVPSTPKVVDIFSDLGQWQLKILLGQRLDKRLITVPRADIRNPTALSALARVSKANSYKLVKDDHFLANDYGLHIVRASELLSRWAPHGSRTTHEIGVARILPSGSPDEALDARLRALQPLQEGDWTPDRWQTPFRVAIAGHAAADRLGAGHVRGTKPVIYMDRVTDDTLRALGLRKASTGGTVDYVVRRPKFPEAVFNAAACVSGVPVTDILQTWMDVQPAPRGDEQAAVIMDRVLAEALS
jgi:hypothetical protein